MPEALTRSAMVRSGELDIARILPPDLAKTMTIDASFNHFEVVVSRWVLWTLPSPAEAIREMARVLKPGGTVVLVDGSRHKPGAFGQMRSNLVNWLLTGRRPGWRGPDYEKVQRFLPHFNPDQTAAAFQANGLNVLDVRQALENETDGRIYAWLMGGVWSSYCVKAAKPS